MCSHKRCCLNIQAFILNHFLCRWTLSSLLFFLCCSFLLSLKSGEFSVLCQCLFKISLSCVSPGPQITSQLCVAINWNDLQAPVVLQYELSLNEKSDCLCPLTFSPVFLSRYTVFSSLSPLPYARVFFS